MTTWFRIMLLCGVACAAFAVRADEAEERLSHQLTALPEPVAAPGFELKDMDGRLHRLEDYRGKVVLVNFWATWCPPCRHEIPSLERLYQRIGSQGFVVLGVNEWEDPDHVFAYTGQLGVDPTYPILFDSDSAVATAFEVNGLPTSYLLDKEGRVRYRAIGGRDFNHPDVAAIVEQLLR